MSAKPKTKSLRKLSEYATSQELDKVAIQIAAERGIPVIEAYREAVISVDFAREKGYAVS